jgi:2-dehydropantoate 2-reductase
VSGAGFDARLSQAIDQELWEKWVLLAPLGGVTCLMRGTIGDIEAVPGGTSLARQLLAECAAVATASGEPPRAEFLAQVDKTLTAAGSGLASSLYRDMERGLEVEADQILGDLAERARLLALELPVLIAAYAHLCVYRRRRQVS